jgi:hypothetical protein
MPPITSPGCIPTWDQSSRVPLCGRYRPVPWLWFLSHGDVLKQANHLGPTGLPLRMLGLGGMVFSWMVFRGVSMPEGFQPYGQPASPA